jgi:hypothetical protein
MDKPTVKRFHFDGDKFIRVFIWNTIEDLRTAVGCNDISGYWKAQDIRIDYSNVSRPIVLTKHAGDIHLYRDGYGSGVFAHELQHFLQSWYCIPGPGLVDDEYWPTIAGNITSEFWRWHYGQTNCK